MIKVGYWGATICLLVACSAGKVGTAEFSKVEKSTFLQHKRWIYDCLKKYMDYSDFLDDNARVTAESIEQFKSLFLNNAKVWNDYLWEPKYEYASVYADQVYYYHRVKGLKVSFEPDILERFYHLKIDELDVKADSSDPSDLTYRYTFKTKKGVFYILNKSQEVIYYNEPIEYELDFVFYVSSWEQKAYIVDILLANKEKR